MVQKKKHRDYSKVKYDDLPTVREPGDRKIITGEVNIDYSVFQKTKAEKLLLKIEKARLKRQQAV